MTWQKRLEDAERRAERMGRESGGPANLIVIDDADAPDSDEPRRRAVYDAGARPLKVLAGVRWEDL